MLYSYQEVHFAQNRNRRSPPPAAATVGTTNTECLALNDPSNEQPKCHVY